MTHDTLMGQSGDDTLNGDESQDLLLGGGDSDLIRGGHGRDTVNGARGADTIEGGAGNDALSGGGGNVSKSHANCGEPVIAQAPLAPLYFADLPRAEAHDLLIGGDGADAFVFQVDINATQEVIRKHTKSHGQIHWHGVDGENNALHDHWVEGFGHDTVADFFHQEGDMIDLIGHTVALDDIDHVDTDADGVDDSLVLTVISDQGTNGGAHHLHVLGTITVQGALINDADIYVSADPRFGLAHSLDHWLTMFG